MILEVYKNDSNPIVYQKLVSNRNEKLFSNKINPSFLNSNDISIHDESENHDDVPVNITDTEDL